MPATPRRLSATIRNPDTAPPLRATVMASFSPRWAGRGGIPQKAPPGELEPLQLLGGGQEAQKAPDYPCRYQRQEPDGAVLALEEGHGPLKYHAPDLLHLGGAGVPPQNIPCQEQGEEDRQHAGNRHNPDQCHLFPFLAAIVGRQAFFRGVPGRARSFSSRASSCFCRPRCSKATVKYPRVFSRMPRTASVVRRRPRVRGSGKSMVTRMP